MVNKQNMQGFLQNDEVDEDPKQNLEFSFKSEFKKGNLLFKNLSFPLAFSVTRKTRFNLHRAKGLIRQFSAIYFPLSVISFILNKAIYSLYGFKYGLSTHYTNLVLINFYQKINYCSQYTFTVCQLFWNHITVYPNNTIRDKRPNDLMFTNYTFQ